jgi:Zn-dependent peptidase ImmA (M78 family)
MYAMTAAAGGCVAVNLNHSRERRREGMAHEYGHFLIARYRAEITVEGRYERRPAGERFAEAFARAFLLPAVGVRRRFLELARERSQGVTFGDLLRLAHLYSVSAETAASRLEELRLLPAGTCARLGESFVQVPAVSPSKPGSASEDEPCSPRYVALAVEAWQQAELSEGQLARILRTDRLGAREKIELLDESIELGAPLLRAVGH